MWAETVICLQITCSFGLGDEPGLFGKGIEFFKPLAHTSERWLIGAMQRLTHRQLEFIDKMGSVERHGLGIDENADIPKPNRYRLPPSKRPRDGTESDRP